MAILDDIITRQVPPRPWEEGDNIPWHEPEFSERMLAEHLTQDHDLASRRTEVIDSQVEWIHEALLQGIPARVLDLACGPGLYLNRLAQRGHAGVGIDFSPAAVAHARGTAAAQDPPVEYVEGDLRSTRFGTGFDLVMMLYGQLNVFRRAEAATMLRQSWQALSPGGKLVVEPQTFEQVEATGRSGSKWSSHRSGLFSARPHLLLTESFWDEGSRTATQRFYVVDAAGDVTAHSMSNEAYTNDDLVALMSDAGLRDIDQLDAMTEDSVTEGLVVFVGHR